MESDYTLYCTLLFLLPVSYKIFLYQNIQKYLIIFNDCVVFHCTNVL